MKKVLPLLASALLITGCAENDDDFERAAEKTEESIEEVGGELKDAAEIVGDRLEEATEETREDIEKAADAAGERLEDAEREFKDSTDEE